MPLPMVSVLGMHAIIYYIRDRVRFVLCWSLAATIRCDFWSRELLFNARHVAPLFSASQIVSPLGAIDIFEDESSR